MYAQRFPTMMARHSKRNAPGGGAKKGLSRNAKIGIGVAGLAVALAWYLWPSTASAAPTPGPAPEPPSPEPPEPPTGPAPTQDKPKPTAEKVNAPDYNWDAVNAYNQEMMYANSHHALWIDALARAGGDVQKARGIYGVPQSRTVASFMTDQVYRQMYPEAWKIPAAANRGWGWDPYIGAWERTYEYIKGLEDVPA